jgi:hypothetical protein
MRYLRAILQLAWSARTAVVLCSLLPFVAFFALTYAAERYLTPAVVHAMQGPTAYLAAYALWTSTGDLLRLALEAAATAAVLEFLTPRAERPSRRWWPGRSAVLLFAWLFVASIIIIVCHQTVRVLIEMLPDPPVGISVYESLGRALLSVLDRLLSFTGPWPLVAFIAARPMRRLFQDNRDEGPSGFLDRAVLALLLFLATRASNLVILAFRILYGVIDAVLEEGLGWSWWLHAISLACFILRELIFVALVAAIMKLRFGGAAVILRMAPAA